MATLIQEQDGLRRYTQWHDIFHCDWCEKTLTGGMKGVAVRKHLTVDLDAYLRYHDECFLKALGEFIHENMPERCQYESPG